MDELLNISPIDGRYAKKTRELEEYFSEFALIKHRVFVEIEWLKFLIKNKVINVGLTIAESKILSEIHENFSCDSARRVKEIESETNHDVKAVEYFLREAFRGAGLEKLNPFIHICLTSEDVNSASYALMTRGALESVYYQKLDALLLRLSSLASEFSEVAMLSHTHGQAATPTTVGKEFKVFECRIKQIFSRLKLITPTAKFGGTVGNFNAHAIAYPGFDWQRLSREFIEGLGLEYNPVTTQIEPHDTLCLILSHVKIINNIIKDLCSDMWLYISRNYFHEKIKSGEVGSSVMPHKVNPINYENSMANVELSNGLIDALVGNLSISRMQRDLSDSSKLRNLGVIFGHAIISIDETLKGLNKVEVNSEFLAGELENNYAVLSEAIQTMLRKNGVENAYELLKKLTRGKVLQKRELHEFIEGLPLPSSDKDALLNLSPNTYTGLAKKLVDEN